MAKGGSRIAAAVDVGSNSVHLLVARVGAGAVTPLLDESAFLGLGVATAAGLLGQEARLRLFERLVADATKSRELGADILTVVGTDPLRRALDAARAVHAVEVATGAPFHVLDYAEEGLLNLVGVTGGRPIEHAVVLADVGGGSSEIVVARPDRSPQAAGLPIGSASLTARHLRHARHDGPAAPDRPAGPDIGAMRREARAALARAPDARPDEVVVVGGTASNVARVTPSAGGARGVEGEILTRGHLDEALLELGHRTPAELVATYRIRPERASVLAAGIVILEALLDRYGLDRVRVSHSGIREGLALVTGHAGRSWRDTLPRLALGWVG